MVNVVSNYNSFSKKYISLTGLIITDIFPVNFFICVRSFFFAFVRSIFLYHLKLLLDNHIRTIIESYCEPSSQSVLKPERNYPNLRM